MRRLSIGRAVLARRRLSLDEIYIILSIIIIILNTMEDFEI